MRMEFFILIALCALVMILYKAKQMEREWKKDAEESKEAVGY